MPARAPFLVAGAAALTVALGAWLVNADGSSSSKPKPTGTTMSQSTVPPPASPSIAAAWRGAGLVSLPEACADIAKLGLSWYYNWWTDPQCPDTPVPFVPMVWGDWCTGAADCPPLPAQLKGSRDEPLLGFNEPDNAEQSNMTVERALQLWPALEATGRRLGSPAVSFDDGGIAWLDAFMTGARKARLRVDFLAIHWYGDCTKPNTLAEYLQYLRKHGLPFWVTEISCYYQSLDANVRLAEQLGAMLAPFLDVERVAWFTNRPYPDGYEFTGLLDQSGALTPIGEKYAALPAYRDQTGRLVFEP